MLQKKGIEGGDCQNWSLKSLPSQETRACDNNLLISARKQAFLVPVSVNLVSWSGDGLETVKVCETSSKGGQNWVSR
jgi:hypothetical protein